MHGEAQCMPLVPLGGQCHAPNSTMLVVFACSHVSQGGEVLWGSEGFMFFIFCVHNLSLFIIVSTYAILFLFVIVSMCVGFKSQDRRSSMHAFSFFRWAIPCPWPSFVGVFYLLMCFSWSWSVCEVLVISQLLFSFMIKTLMFYVCTILLFFTLFCVWRFQEEKLVEPNITADKFFKWTRISQFTFYNLVIVFMVFHLVPIAPPCSLARLPIVYYV